ncbi:MAG: FAD-dependent oxidoreductase [Chloroflexi bacterium]|nr:FAD-dependent oxidoreductase [Chloroflexota bacterium]
MTSWWNYIQQTASIPEWAYPIRYDVENQVTTDVLVLGGGIAGCHAAINAARKGARVAIVDKGSIRRSGQGGAGVDHWQAACTNPCSKVSPEEYAQASIDSFAGYDCGSMRYIQCRESWDTLLDCEKMGVQIRDVHDEFKGAAFRDDETKLMFTYDYENRHTLRVYGHNIKPRLHREVKRLGVQIFDRVMATSLLTEDGKQGTRVVGATGVNVRTGEFYIFKAKAIVLAMAHPRREWTFSTELNGGSATFADLNIVGDGHAMGWNAGAEFAAMERSIGSAGGFAYIQYGVGYPDNTWYGCTMVDAQGKQVRWFNRDGQELKTTEERFQPAPGQKFILMGGGLVGGAIGREVKGNYIDNTLSDLIRKGEIQLPLYADLPSLPEHERRAIFGLMVGNEGKSRIPVYDIYTKAGFDPDKDMLQAPVMPPDAYKSPHYPAGAPVPQWREIFGGGLVADWDMRSSLEGLYAGGRTVYGGGEHAGAATSGRYAGRKAAEYALNARELELDQKQIEREKARVYAPLQKSTDSIGWKEMNAGICRIMQDYCGQYRNEETLQAGLRILASVRESELTQTYAANPHELERVLECHTIITVGELVMHASLARKASSRYLNFYRLDYPELDPVEWHKLLPIRLEDNQVRVRELPHDYHLRAPFASSYEENYQAHCGL